jgi:hypothetical protein
MILGRDDDTDIHYIIFNNYDAECKWSRIRDTSM